MGLAREGRRRRLLTGDKAVIALAVVSLLALVAVPIIMLIFTSVRGPVGRLPFEPDTVFTLDNFRRALRNPGALNILRDTVVYIGGSVGLAFVLGATLAWLVERTKIPFSGLMFTGVLLPFLFPPSTIVNIWLGLFFPRTGDFNVYLREHFFTGLETGPIDPFTMWFMVLGQGLLLTPIVFLLLSASLRNMNGTLEEASHVSGGGSLTTFRRITLPVLVPGVVTALVLAVWLTLDASDIPLSLGTRARAQLLNLRIIQAGTFSVGGVSVAAAYAVLTMSFLFLLFIGYSRLTRQGAKYATVTAHARRAARQPLGWWSLPALVLSGVYFAAMWGIPVYGLVRGSIRGGLSAYGYVLGAGDFWQAVVNTLVIAGGSATIGTLVVVLVSWVVVRSKSGIWRHLLDLVATSSLVIPASLAAVAFLLIFLTAHYLPLYGTVLGLTIALSYRVAIPYRVSNVGMRQIGRDMEEASAASGATPLTTLRRVVLPLLAPTVAVSWAIFFIFNVREITIVRYLGGNVPVFNNLPAFGGPPGTRAATTVLTMVIVIGVLLLVRRALLRRTKLW